LPSGKGAADPEIIRGRLATLGSVAVIDIGSNTVRLVVYEGPSRAPTPIFNERVMCGLGKGLASSGKLSEEGVGKALSAIARFKSLCAIMGVSDFRVVATAAARDAANGPGFVERVSAILGVQVMVLTGRREAELAALGVIAGFDRPDGVVGDLGGGSLELIGVSRRGVMTGVSLQIGGLVLADRSGGSVKKAEKIVKSALIGIPQIAAMADRTFYAVGGTWRALARLHMRQTGYPLNVMHNYAIPARDALDFASIVERADSESLAAIDAVSAARRPLLAFGAVVLEQIVRRGRPTRVVISALGLREGLLFEGLSEEERRRDPLIVAANDLNELRSRSPRHGWDLIAWCDALFASLAIDESDNERRLRHAACLLADIGWRAHPDYRGEQSMSIIANAAFVGVDHPGRAFLALAVFYRHVGLADSNLGPQLRELAGLRLQDRARILGAAMRVAYLLSAAMPDVLARTPLQASERQLVLRLPTDLGSLASERLVNRLRQLARLVGREARVIAAS
jgi:exopolyphosphatase/guanosine-5'-triphosphate,3'-diphosphate pyrophosphatase